MIDSIKSTALLISLSGENLVEVSESESALTLRLVATGFSFGAIPLHVAPVSYSQYEELRGELGLSSLSEIASNRTIPPDSALPCE